MLLLLIMQSKTNDADEPIVCSTVCVKNLSYDLDENAIRNYFSRCGQVINVRRPLDENGSPKGFCFIDFAKGEHASAALELNETALSGRMITVESSMKSKAAKGETNKKTKLNDDTSDSQEIFVRNVNIEATDDDIKKFFAKCGTITYAIDVTNLLLQLIKAPIVCNWFKTIVLFCCFFEA